MRKILALYGSYMLTAVVWMVAAALVLGMLTAPQPERYLFAVAVFVFVAVLFADYLFLYIILPRIVARLNQYEGKENRSPLKLVLEVLGR